MTRIVEVPISVRIKVGAHAGEIREVPRNVGLEMADLGRVELVAPDGLAAGVFGTSAASKASKKDFSEELKNTR